MSTIPTVASIPLVDFPPTKIYPSFSSIINQYYRPVTYSNAANNTLLASDLIGGLITHSTAGAQTDTLPAASLLIPAIQGASDVFYTGGPQSEFGISGSGIRVIIRSGTGAITIAPGVGGTMNPAGNFSIAANSAAEFLIIVTKVGDKNAVGATYTVYPLGAVLD